MSPVDLASVNAMSPGAFLTAFGDVAEHSPWVAEAALVARPFADRRAMVNAFHDALSRGSMSSKLQVLRAHPDLAGKAAVRGELTDDSLREQAGAGLDELTPEEFERFSRLNQRYLDRVGIPFIFAVRGATKSEILQAFETRLNNAIAPEIELALSQVAQIMAFRIEDRVRD